MLVRAETNARLRSAVGLSASHTLFNGGHYDTDIILSTSRAGAFLPGVSPLPGAVRALPVRAGAPAALARAGRTALAADAGRSVALRAPVYH